MRSLRQLTSNFPNKSKTSTLEIPRKKNQNSVQTMYKFTKLDDTYHNLFFLMSLSSPEETDRRVVGGIETSCLVVSMSLGGLGFLSSVLLHTQGVF